MRAAAHRASIVTLGYLVVTLPLFVRAPWSLDRTVVGLLHLGAIGCVWWSLKAKRAALLARDWLPLVLVPFLYGELPYLRAHWQALGDATVQSWEFALFQTQPARTLAGEAPNLALSEFLHLGYLLYYPTVYLPPLLLYVRGRREEFGRTALAVMLTYVACFLAFVVFPVEGPRYAWGAPPGVPVGPVRSLTLEILERGSSRGTAFPSSHAAVAVAQAVMALRYQRRVGVVVSVSSVLLMVGAVYGGFHYAVDILAGAILGLLLATGVATRLGTSNSRRDGYLRPSSRLPNFTRP